MTVSKAFNNNLEAKERYISLLRENVETYDGGGYFLWQLKANGGAAWGCAWGKAMVNKDFHRYEEDFGLPVIVARIENEIFEALRAEEAKKFRLDCASAISVGADLSLVWPKLAVKMLDYVEEKVGGGEYRKVADLYREVVNGEKVLRGRWYRHRTALHNSYAAMKAAEAGELETFKLDPKAKFREAVEAAGSVGSASDAIRHSSFSTASKGESYPESSKESNRQTEEYFKWMASEFTGLLIDA